MGWPGIAIAEEYGGLGLGFVEAPRSSARSWDTPWRRSPFAATTGAALPPDRELWHARAEVPLASVARLGQCYRANLAITDGRVAHLVPDADRALVIVLIDNDTAILVERSNATVDVAATIDPTSRYARVSGANGAPMAGLAEAVDRAEVLVAAHLTRPVSTRPRRDRRVRQGTQAIRTHWRLPGRLASLRRDAPRDKSGPARRSTSPPGRPTPTRPARLRGLGRQQRATRQPSSPHRQSRRTAA